MSGSTSDLRLEAEAVISFETFFFSAKAPPVPRPSRLKERGWLDGGGMLSEVGTGDAKDGEGDGDGDEDWLIVN